MFIIPFYVYRKISLPFVLVQLSVFPSESSLPKMVDSTHARRNEIQINCRKGELILTRQDIVKLEKEITATNQYGRRENLVIDGIPDSVPQYELENTCLEIVQKLGFKNVGCY